jgi:hypothetical protein
MASEQGAIQMLLQLGEQFSVIDREADFRSYRVIIAPDGVRFDEGLSAKLRHYLANGGALLLSHESGLRADGSGFALADEMGIEYVGSSGYDVEFLRPEPGLVGAIPSMDHALYESGSAVRAKAGTEVLGVVIPPFFSRTWEHFNSHAQTPPDLTARPEFAAVTLRAGLAYISHPVFSAYQLHGYPVYRQLVAALLARLLPKPLLRTNLPTTAEVSLLRQVLRQDDGLMERLVCHILHYVPQRRTPDLDLVEDVIPLHEVTIAIRSEWTPRIAYLAPERTDLEVTMDGDYARLRVPRIYGHAMVVLER